MMKSNIECLKGIVYIAYERKCKAVFKNLKFEILITKLVGDLKLVPINIAFSH